MPKHCYRVVAPDGTVAIVCGNFGPPCHVCGGMPEALCDFPLGDDGKTCDKPLCFACAPTIGANKNYCPSHGDVHGLLLFRPPPPSPAQVAAKLEATQRLLLRKCSLCHVTGHDKRKCPIKPPPADKQWRVRQLDNDAVLSRWMDEVSARQAAAGRGPLADLGRAFRGRAPHCYVESYEQWKAKYLASVKPRVLKTHDIEGCKGCPWCTGSPPTTDR